MEFTERVLILRVGKFRESDLWVRFLSPSRGILSAFAFGGARSRRRFPGCLDSFNDVLFQIRSSRNGAYLAIQEGTLMSGPRLLRADWRRFGLAQNCRKFLEAFGVAPDGAPEAHALFSGVLALLEEEDSPPAGLPLLFRARLVFDQGYALDFQRCARCGESLVARPTAYFQIEEGRILCQSCRNIRETGPVYGFQDMPVARETRDALVQVRKDPLSAWKHGTLATLSDTGKRECLRIVDSFIQYHVGLYWGKNGFSRG